MSLLFDQNLSRKLPKLLSVEFPGSEHVMAAGLSSEDDRAVWSYAADHGLAVVSKDADFQALSILLGPPPKVIWLRIGNGPTKDVEDLIRSHKSEIDDFLAQMTASILELS